MRIDMPTCQYGEDHCRKRFDGNCLLNPDLLDERCPIRRTINDVLEIIDDVFMEVSNGLIHTPSEALEETHNRVNGLKGEQW